VGFEPTISVLERAKTVRALDRAATAIGFSEICQQITSLFKVEQKLQTRLGPYLKII
jgi:hypothetical protein